MKTIAEIKNNVEEYHDKPWFAIGLLVGGFETDEIRRKAPQVYHAIYKKVAFDEGTFGKMLVFLGKEGMKEKEQEKLRNWLKEWVPAEEDKDAKYWFLSGFVNGQVEIHQKEWISLSEATELWKLGESTLRSTVKNNRFHEDEIRKSGKVWLVTKQAMERLYGKIETFEPKRFIISKETKELLSIESLDKKLEVGTEDNIILEFLSIYDNYSFIVSFNGVKQKGTICFKDSEKYPLLYLTENNIYLRITKQEVIDYIWVSMGKDRVGVLYGFTTEFKNNYVE